MSALTYFIIKNQRFFLNVKVMLGFEMIHQLIYTKTNKIAVGFLTLDSASLALGMHCPLVPEEAAATLEHCSAFFALHVLSNTEQ